MNLHRTDRTKYAHAYIRGSDHPHYIHGQLRIFTIHEVIADILGKFDDVFSSMQVEVPG